MELRAGMRTGFVAGTDEGEVVGSGASELEADDGARAVAGF